MEVFEGEREGVTFFKKSPPRKHPQSRNTNSTLDLMCHKCEKKLRECVLLGMGPKQKNADSEVTRKNHVVSAQSSSDALKKLPIHGSF